VGSVSAVQSAKQSFNIGYFLLVFLKAGRKTPGTNFNDLPSIISQVTCTSLEKGPEPVNFQYKSGVSWT
jgi:hypothetical protein